MREILTYLPILAILVLSNILLGTVYNTSVEDMDFDKMKLLNGLKKGASVAVAFVGVAYAFEVVDIGGDILTPDLIMTTAIGTYAAKIVVKLTEILGLKKDTSSESESDSVLAGEEEEEEVMDEEGTEEVVADEEETSTEEETVVEAAETTEEATETATEE